MRYDISAESRPRKREYVWMIFALLIAIYLVMARLEASDVSYLVIEDANRHAQIYKVVADCMNGYTIYIENEPVVQCRQMRKP